MDPKRIDDLTLDALSDADDDGVACEELAEAAWRQRLTAAEGKRDRAKQADDQARAASWDGLVSSGLAYQGHVIDAQAKAIRRSGEAEQALEEAQRALEAEQAAGPQVTR